MKALAFIASVLYLAAVLAFPLPNKSGGVKGLTSEYVNVTVTDTPTQGFIKRQNQQALAITMNSIATVVSNIATQEPNRAQFTQDLVATLWTQNPHYNYIACHVAHSYYFQGQQGVDWDHQEAVYYRRGLSPYGYDVIVAGAGVFLLEGDGGYTNWAYYGYVASDQTAGQARLITFATPP